MLIPCPGCKKTYNHGISMSNHQRKCSKLKIVTKERLFRRQENAKKRQEAKISKLEAEDTGLDMRNNIRERSNDFLEAGDATSGRKRKLQSQEVINIQLCVLNLKSDALFSQDLNPWHTACPLTRRNELYCVSGSQKDFGMNYHQRPPIFLPLRTLWMK
jgi:hypothetical protein